MKANNPIPYAESGNTLSAVEAIKTNSQLLRGTINQSLKDPITGSVTDDDSQLIKFHGIYQQDDREIRVERQTQKLEPAYNFMIRARVPAGICTPKQWLAMDEISDLYANATIRLTTRQALQFHGILKTDLKHSLQHMDSVLMDSIAACGDVNRNIMCNPNSNATIAHEQVYQLAKQIGEHLLPKSRAYHEIWLDGEKYSSTEVEDEPIYGKTYLPRKFKIGVAIPPINDVDIYSQDLGFIAIIKEEQLVGFNVVVGGGMGATHGLTSTYPRLADEIGFCTPEQVLDVAEQVVKNQRDYGNRGDRKFSRLKYTIDNYGIDWFKAELSERLTAELEDAAAVTFIHRGDQFGWHQSHDGLWHFTLYVENGRVQNATNQLMRNGLKEIALLDIGDFRITPNQNLIIANIPEQQRQQVTKLIEQFQLDVIEGNELLHKNALACVALQTCPQAMSEAERYLAEFLAKVDDLLQNHELHQQPMTIRITGCPNGCARPYLAEIALVGKAPGRYNLHLGGSYNGDRLNQLYKENLNEQQILAELDQLFDAYKNERFTEELLGDFILRNNWLNQDKSKE